MQMRIFTLRFNPVTENFDESAVAEFVKDKEVLSIDNHFFVKEEVPYLVLVVRYRTLVLPAPADTGRSKKRRDDSWRELLTEDDWPLFNTLRSWRGEHAKKEGIPFLGFRIYPGVIRLNPRNLRRFRRQVRGLERAYRSGRLGMEEMSQSIASLFAHVAHADTLHLRRVLVEDSLDLG